MSGPKDAPIIPYDGDKPHHARVVDLAEVRIRWGTAKSKPCAHKQITYCKTERRVWCDDCERTIDAFDALMTMARHFQEMQSEADRRLYRAKEAETATVVRRAAKEIDREWGRKMAPCCPHCRKGLLPEDFERGSAAAVSRELEIARRKRDV